MFHITKKNGWVEVVAEFFFSAFTVKMHQCALNQPSLVRSYKTKEPMCTYNYYASVHS
jgi:hypothetical protein